MPYLCGKCLRKLFLLEQIMNYQLFPRKKMNCWNQKKDPKKNHQSNLLVNIQRLQNILKGLKKVVRNEKDQKKNFYLFFKNQIVS